MRFSFHFNILCGVKRKASMYSLFMMEEECVEKVTFDGSQRQIERFLIAIYTLYSITLLLISGQNGWGKINDIIWTGCLVIAWVLYLSSYRTYAFRMNITAVLMQVTVILYAMHSKEFPDILPTFMVFVVLLSLTGISEIIFLTMLSIAIIFFGHLFVVKTVTDMTIAVSQLMNIFLLQFVVYTWIKRTDEGSRNLLKVIEELKVVQRSKDDFVANVSHEIRTPINTICGMSEIMLREDLPYNLKENVQSMQIAGRNLMGVVSDILDFSELQSGKIELEEEAYNITSTINDVINMTMARKNEKKLELIVDCDATIPSVLLGDEKKLRRVIMNLVDNAIKFTEEGCVSLTIGYRKESYGINLIISVKDTGIGMDAESLEQLFVSFAQVDTSTKRQEGGLGLGLAISHALMQKMGGAITVKSKLGKGTVVKIVVPQKVLDEEPVASLQDRDNISVATYIDMEQFTQVTIRDEYSAMIRHMVEQLRGKCHICRNLAELQRRHEYEKFSHIFISITEYRADQAYFDELAKQTNVVVILNHHEERYVTNQDIFKICKPFYILTIVSVLNGLYDKKRGRQNLAMEKFVTKDAHVLVVDDNRMNLRVVEELLANYRIKVTTASSGEEALDKIVTVDYDFVFMDHMMPEMDGVETLRRIRGMLGTYYKKVPVVALTANAVAGTREALLAEGFNDFLEKPIERSVLERVLKRNLPAEKIIAKDAIVPEQNKTEEYDFQIPELDVEKGILYCNGKEQYIRILRGYCEDWDNSSTLAETLFEKEDWKNYTIAVHGMKSAMRSIGAMQLSEKARLLEYAGKENRIGFIRDNHRSLMEEYIALFEQLKKNEIICPKKVQEEVVEETVELNKLPILSTDLLERTIEQMEETMYTLDGERLLELITMLEGYQYKGRHMQEVLAPIRRKVEMYDYVSAVESVIRWKSELTGKEK